MNNNDVKTEDKIDKIISTFFPNTEVELINDEMIFIKSLDVFILEFSFYITSDMVEIKIENLNASPEYSGTNILFLTELFVKSYSRSYKIYFSDSSNLVKNGYKFSLSLLYILCNGKSWYNSKGFYGKNYLKEFEIWQSMRRVNAYINSEINFSPEILNFWKEKFNTDLKMETMKNIGKIILKEINEMPTNIESVMYQDILKEIKKIFPYSSFLIKEK